MHPGHVIDGDGAFSKRVTWRSECPKIRFQVAETEPPRVHHKLDP
jgi:hypothetical protein